MRSIYIYIYIYIYDISSLRVKFLDSKLEDRIFWKTDRYISKTLRAPSHLLGPLMSTPSINEHKFNETP